MRSLGRFKVAMVAAVLIALLTAVGGLVISQAAGGGSGIQATVYNDAVRFTVQNEKVSILRAEVFNLSGKRLFDSGPVMGKALDWNMSTEAGERVAHGVYLYVITAWDSQGELVKSQVGKLALVPGGVGLGQAPALISEEGSPTPEKGSEQVKALGYDHAGDWTVSGNLGVGTDSPTNPISVQYTGNQEGIRLLNSGIFYLGPNLGEYNVKMYSLFSDSAAWDYFIGLSGGYPGYGKLRFVTGPSGSPQTRMVVDKNGNVGIGTTSPSAALEVKGSTANLLVLKDPPGNTVFRVEKDGDVYADRSYNCGLSSGCFNSGSGADVAERINVSGTVEPGDVVEIDPVNPGLYRKAQAAYSTRVAGVISTAPAITLGNNFDAQADKWTDSRPLLALAGRVPVKVTAENGPIKIGDFLTTSSMPGYAMRCGDLSRCTGAILGKALEPLAEGTGVIMVQVTLR